MEGVDAAKLMELFNAQTGTVNTLWNIFAAISLGVLGFALKEKDLRDNWKLKAGFTLAFIIFAFGNLDAISRSQAILVAISDTLSALAEGHQYGTVLRGWC